ncbi:MAG: hypothetical protein JNK79_05350 [Chitinophagaceae bacterium]|nr:hypothetical protein [Chitinophagaceae bacterium]
MRAVLVFLLCLPVFSASAQDLTGIWRGHFKSGESSKLMDSLGIDDRYKFETQINQTDKSFEGVTYSYKSTVFYGKASCYGAVNTKTKKVFLEENKLIEVQSLGGACLMTLFLQYSKVGNEEFLEGKFEASSVKDSTACPGGTVFLRKVPTTDFYKEPFLVEREQKMKKNPPPVAKTPPPATKPATTAKPLIAGKKTAPPPKSNIASAPKKQATTPARPATPKPKTPKPSVPNIPAPKPKSNIDLATDSFKKIAPGTNIGTPVPRVFETRVNELVKTIVTSAKDVSIKIYDNGTIDNDTVSVYVDNKLVISKHRLTDKALTLKINLDEKATFHELVMVAENLGEIPPNTSLMIVNAGDKQYEVRITSTEQKNAVIHFKREP